MRNTMCRRGKEAFGCSQRTYRGGKAQQEPFAGGFAELFQKQVHKVRPQQRHIPVVRITASCEHLVSVKEKETAGHPRRSTVHCVV